MSRRRLSTIAILIAALGPAHADPAADKAAILQRFAAWTTAFNARDATGACDLFAPDLSYSIPEIPDGTYEQMCGNLTRLLGRSDVRAHYAEPEIHEIIVDRDLAMVRLTWTLTIEVGGESDVTTEQGMDIFRRQPDGRWSIARFIAFNPPE